MPLLQNDITVQRPAYAALQHHHGQLKFSWRSELRHFFSYKFLNLFLWPAFRFKQRRFTNTALFKQCNQLPGFTDLWKTIQKGAFAYNTLFLKTHPYRYPRALDLADITTLSLFFGDEFIDGISTAAGKSYISQLINADPERFYLKKKKCKSGVSLQYHFDLFHLLPDEIWNQVNEKYCISYRRFYMLLQHFLELINDQLRELSCSDAEMAADRIVDACNTCFRSFLHDINDYSAPGNIPPVPTVLHFHETKTACMQARLLELRCTLANKEYFMNTIDMPGWLDIMRVIQIYDDLHDIVIDHDVQDNLLLSIAYHYFPTEWEWFISHKDLLTSEKKKPLLLSLYMPCSTEHCMQLASEKINKMNWEQQKIMHYLLFKNKYVLYKQIKDRILTTNAGFLLQFYGYIKDNMAYLPAKVIKSYVINTCIHLPGIRKRLLKKVNFSVAYQLKYNLFSVSADRKAAIFDALTTKK